MIPELLWIIGFYVAAAALAHRLFRQGADERRRHYVLVAGNHQMQIEWYIRTLQRFSRCTGTDIGITVVLENSSDDTGQMLDIFSRGCDVIGVFRTDGTEGAGTDDVCVEDDDAQGAAADWEQAAGVSRTKLLKKMQEQGLLRSPFQIVWVELSNQEDLQRLPLGHCRLVGNRIQ